jgi:hypothetical protein
MIATDCPKCGRDSVVRTCRKKAQGFWRVRECLACSARWQTLEVLFDEKSTPLAEEREARRRRMVEYREAAYAAGMSVGLFSLSRRVARERAAKQGISLIESYRQEGVLTKREMILLKQAN